MSILDNAVESISIGIEDFQTNDPRRVISCARNFFAGVLLLFKHRLSQLSPPGSDEALLKERVVPTRNGGQVQWQGQGTKTVDLHQIEDRFRTLGIAVDWGRVRNIQKYRNEIEHYYSTRSHSAVRGVITDCFVVVRDFVRDELQLDPLTIFDPETWSEFTKEAAVYQKEKAACVQHIAAIDWEYSELEDALPCCNCPECGSGLIDTDPNCSDRNSATFTCLSCGNSFPFEKFAAKAMSDYFAGENFVREKDGGEPTTTRCPNCQNDSFLIEDGVCTVCGESADTKCSLCGCDIPASEIDGGSLCGYCSHMMSKDD